ncbi:hypothetical protein GJ496_003794 [Pomphorhynchus laevis]|nr:hypothetical protein GJ496_003794 [Pomphorhynchus laevis]
MKRSARSRVCRSKIPRTNVNVKPSVSECRIKNEKIINQIVIPEHINIDGVDFDCFNDFKLLDNFFATYSSLEILEFTGLTTHSSNVRPDYQPAVPEYNLPLQSSITAKNEETDVEMDYVDVCQCKDSGSYCNGDTTPADNIDVTDTDEPSSLVSKRSVSPSIVARYLDTSLCARLRPFIPKSLRPEQKADVYSPIQNDAIDNELNNEMMQKNRQMLSKTIENCKVEMIDLKIEKLFGRQKKPTVPISFSSYISIGRLRKSILKLISKILSSDYTLWRHMDLNYSNSILIRLQKTCTLTINCIVANPNRLPAIDCEQRWKSLKEVCQFGSLFGIRFHAHQYESLESHSTHSGNEDPVVPLILRRSSQSAKSSTTAFSSKILIPPLQESPLALPVQPLLPTVVSTSGRTSTMTSKFSTTTLTMNKGATVKIIKTSMRDVVDSFLKRKQTDSDSKEISTIRIISPATRQRKSDDLPTAKSDISNFEILERLYNDLLSKHGSDIVHIPIMNSFTSRFRRLCISALMKRDYSDQISSVQPFSKSNDVEKEIQEYLDSHFRSLKNKEFSSITDGKLLDKAVHRQLLQIQTYTVKMLCWSTKNMKTVDYEPLKLYKHVFEIIQYSYYFNEPLTTPLLSAFQLTLRRLYCHSLAEDSLCDKLKLILQYVSKLIEYSKARLSLSASLATSTPERVTTPASSQSTTTVIDISN